MSDVKTMIFPEGGNSSFDPNLWASLNGGMGGFNNPFWAIILLAFLRNGFGWGGNEANCDKGFIGSQLGQAIAGNANALSNLATHLDCTEGQIQGAIGQVQAAVQQLANQSNMSTMQVVNAVNTGNASMMNSLQSCCCDLKQAVTSGFSSLAYENAAQTCQIKQAICDNSAAVIAKLDAIEDSRKDREIASLTAALTAANSRAERQAELAPIYKALSDIECKQPNTITVPNPSAVAVPACLAYQYGLSPYGYANGGVFG